MVEMVFASPFFNLQPHMFGVIIVVAVVFVAVILYLPYALGLTEFEKSSRKKLQKLKESASSEHSGYVPPDEEHALRQQKEESLKGKASALRERINVTSEDVPVKIRLHQDGLRKRTKEKLDVDTNPSNYDYDLDELIREENEEAAEAQRRDFYKNEVIGKGRDEMV